MKSKGHHSIFLTGKSWYFFHAIALAWVLILFFTETSAVGPHIRARIVSPILFHTRELLGQTPPLTDKLKIYALDDSTFSLLGGPRLKSKDLHDLLVNLALRQPKAIIIDGLLSDVPNGEYEYIDRLKKSNYPIFTGAYINPMRIRYRHILNKDQTAFKISHYLGENTKQEDLRIPFDRKYGWVVYGHDAIYQGAFRGQGHITYNEDGTISPFYQISDSEVIPHLSLFAADEIRFHENQILIDGHQLPLSSKGGTVINHRPPEDFYLRTKSLQHALSRAKNHEPEELVQKGDIVLILLAFATGNTDFHEGSPFGEIPGGLVIASMISDVVEGTWLTKHDSTPLYILFLTILGTILGINGNVARFWIGFIGVTILYLIVTIIGFSYFSLLIPWLFPYLAFAGTSIVYFIHVRLQEEFKLISIEADYYAEKSLRLEQESKKAQLEGYLALGRAVQQLLLPESLSGNFRQFYYEMQYHPHLKMAGDWLYVWKVSNREFRILIGDVMGKGPSAAIPVATIISILKECENQKMSLGEALQRLNSRLIQLFNYHITTTVAAIAFHHDGRCELYNAGSPGWFMSTKEGIDFFMLRSNPLGIIEQFKIAHYELNVPPKAILFTFTDGYLEGSRELHRFLKQLRTHSIDGSSRSLHDQLNRSKASDAIDDDQTLITIRCA